MDKRELIIGIHSIAAALANRHRSGQQLFVTNDGLDKFKKYLNSAQQTDILQKLLAIEIVHLDLNKFNVQAQKLFKERGLEFSRITSQLLLVSSAAGNENFSQLLKKCQGDSRIKLLALDNVTDINNGAAILRTAAFFAVDALILAIKGNFSLTPSFYRIASGATEYVRIVTTNNLSRSINELQTVGVECIGLSERSNCSSPSEGEEEGEDEEQIIFRQKRCLVLGNEENGISPSVMRMLKKKVALSALGEIKSLNVSVAAAIAMERFLKY